MERIPERSPRRDPSDDVFLAEQQLVEIDPPTRRIRPSEQEEREDEPDLRESVVDALIRAGLTVKTDFSTEVTEETIRVTFTSWIPAAVWGALVGYDVASDGPNALRVGYSGAFAASADDRRVA